MLCLARSGVNLFLLVLESHACEIVVVRSAAVPRLVLEHQD